jgi:streptothricin acetyltransferase
MSNIEIIKLDKAHLSDVNRCNGEFWIESRLRLNCVDSNLQYEVVPVAPRMKKRYPVEDRDLSTYLDNPERAIFLAYLDGTLAGQIILRKNWNGYGYIEDITVDSAFRRRGIGRLLLAQAADWTRAHGFPGLMLETQDINVAACRLYSACGFSLSGFDQNLYTGLDPTCSEIALYWYKVF